MCSFVALCRRSLPRKISKNAKEALSRGEPTLLRSMCSFVALCRRSLPRKISKNAKEARLRGEATLLRSRCSFVASLGHGKRQPASPRLGQWPKEEQQEDL